MRAIFIRHAESTANVGALSADVATIALTDAGMRQAEDVASKWTEKPTLIVVSSFLRTQQTAEPTKLRFPDVPVEVWPVHEFTYLSPKQWNGTCRAERAPALKRYWTTCDPHFCDGRTQKVSVSCLPEYARRLNGFHSVPQMHLSAYLRTGSLCRHFNQ